MLVIFAYKGCDQYEYYGCSIKGIVKVKYCTISGIEAHPQSELLWEMHLKYKISKNYSEEEIYRTFEKGKAALKENALPLFEELIKHYLVINATDDLESLYESALYSPQQISHALIPDYLKWLTVTCGRDISKARLIYDDFSTRRPYCKKLHTVMASLECAEEDMQNWERVLKLATDQFPEDLDVWRDYMNFFVHFRKSAMSDDRKNIQ